MERKRDLSGGYCPDWRWWIRAGERLQMGLGLGRVLDAGGEDLGDDGSKPVQDRVAEKADRGGVWFVTDGVRQWGLWRKRFRRKGREEAGLERLRVGLREGLGLVEAMQGSGMMLPLEGWGYLLAGEQTGRSGEAFCAVAGLLEEREKRRRERIGQLWYPVLLLLIGALVLGLLLLWVIPALRELNQDMGNGGELPWLTQHLGTLYMSLLGGMVIGGLLGLAGWRTMESGSRRSIKWGERREWVMRRLPGMGTVWRSAREARLLGQLGPLLRSGHAIPRALELVASGLPSKWEAAALMAFRSHLLHGASFMEGFCSCALFSHDSRALISLGEESGRLDDFMDKRARELRESVRWWGQQLSRATEPMLLMGLALAVGGMLVAYLLPMLHLMEGFQL
jgi:type II secretory pathway component PulF